jgi:S-adenosylmethionine hydrolase
MKAVILSIHPKVFIVDITHDITKFNILMGAFVLASAAPYFSAGSIHVAVVDPGVGTRRRAIIVETKRSYYVGPDNGLMMLAAQREGIEHVYHVTNPQYMLPRVSRTFHGRDIFAPAAAHLAKGDAPSESGPEIQDYSLPEFAQPRVRRGDLIGEVIHIDDFGNVVSNFSEKDLKRMGIHDECTLCVKLNDRMCTLKLCSAYSQVPAGTPLTIIGSSDFLEVSVNQGSASRMFKVKTGDSIQISLQSSNQTLQQSRC